mgnify:CR=1 FL=1
MHQRVPCPPVVCVIVKSSGRGAAVDVDGRIVTGIVGDVVAVTPTPTLEGGRVVVSDAAAATVTAAGSAADGRIDDAPTAAARSEDAASSMLEKGKRNKNETKNIGIQGFDVILQLGVGHRLIAQLLSCDV